MAFGRRRFLKTVSAGILRGGVAAPLIMSHSAFASPLQRKIQTSDSPVFNLGLATYSFKPHFPFYKGKPVAPLDGKSMDMFQFIDYCAEQNCAAELTSYFFPPDANEAYFREIKRHAFVNGVPIVGTAIGNNFSLEKGEKLDQQIAEAKLWIDRAVQMGAPHIRFFAGKRKELEEAPGRMKNAIEALQECVDYAAKAGVFIGVENHGDLTADHMLKIISSIDSQWLGVNLDSGNFVTDDPYDELAKCAPYAINVQIKVKMKTETKGVKIDSDMARVANIFKESNYRGFVVMEYEEGSPFENVPIAMDELRKNFTV